MVLKHSEMIFNKKVISEGTEPSKILTKNNQNEVEIHFLF